MPRPRSRLRSSARFTLANSGQPITIGGHNISVSFRDEVGSEHRVWEWHSHVLTPDEDNCYSLEHIFGNYFEKRIGEEGIWGYVL
ncbi:hypothetical protein AAC387_Pa05g3753 [Persea americana]